MCLMTDGYGCNSSSIALWEICLYNIQFVNNRTDYKNIYTPVRSKSLSFNSIGHTCCYTVCLFLICCWFDQLVSDMHKMNLQLSQGLIVTYFLSFLYFYCSEYTYTFQKMQFISVWRLKMIKAKTENKLGKYLTKLDGKTEI